ncbi:M24 family metallopeptidase [Salinithrix halophila]|uniref:M24 family metallopeptidase n=1 Tax=Salinithrix halophila TaxID=1485204 RepID=A0ABV8JII9_9BACL
MTLTYTRLTHVSDWLKEERMDGALITSPSQIFYLTSFHCEPYERLLGLFLFPGAEPFLICPALEEDRARQSGWDQEIIAYSDVENPWERIGKAIEARGDRQATRIAVEKESLSIARAEALTQLLPQAKFFSLEEPLHNFRAIKDEREIRKMEEAARLADLAVEIGLNSLTEGCIERETAALIDFEMKKRGAEGMAFNTTVLFGENTGFPHGTPGLRELAPGDLVLFDLGVIHEGYCSDITRTFAFRSVSEEQTRLYETVLKGQEAALSLSRPGTRIGDLDVAARQVITDEGYGDYFTHRVGHGLGIDPHEFPSIHGNNNQTLKEGMVFTIEPGAYIPDFGGVRIEDDVLITREGSRTLTRYPKELQVIR